MIQRNIIIDTDIGIDDAFAIVYASLSSNINIVGITSVFGNVDIETSTKNTQYIKTLCNLSCPIAKGAAHALFLNSPTYSYHVHGRNGLGDVPLPSLPLSDIERISAVQLMASLVEEQENVTIVSIGPLTNVATFLMQYPHLQHKIQEILIMGGAFVRGGNVTPVAEANIWHDPHAAEVVFRSSCKIKAFGLDVTQYMELTQDMLESDSDTLYKQFLYSIAPFYINFYQSTYHLAQNAMICHDAIPFLYLNYPDKFDFAIGRVAISLDGLTKGQSIFEQFPSSGYDAFFFNRSAHKVALQVDSTFLIQEFLNTTIG